MKKTLAILFALGLAVSAFAWGKQGHATVAKIAEDHLTPATQKAISEILDGHSIVEYSAYADEYKTSKHLLYDFGPDIKDDKRINSYPHTFEVDMNFKPFPTYNDNGRYVKNCLWFIKEYSEDLVDYRNLDKQDAFIKLVMVVHWLGDMHCPEHMRYNPEDMTIGNYQVIYKGESIRYHTFWDAQCIIDRFPWSFTDLAYLFDTATEEQIAEIVKGDVYAWGEDAARECYYVHKIKEGDTLTKKWLLESKSLVSTQLAKGGYRLAHVLNMTFDKKYAKKHSK